MKQPQVESSYTQSLIAIIEETQKILRESALSSSVAMTWLPLCSSLSEKKPLSASTNSITKPSLSTPSESSAPLSPPPQLVSESLSKNPKPIAQAASKPIEAPSNETKQASSPLSSENKSIKKVGKFTLQLPGESSSDTQEVYDWLKTKGLIEQTSQKPRLLSSKKMALSPAIILYHPTSNSVDALKRLCSAINENLTACCMIQDTPSLSSLLIEALERGRVDCIICEKNAPEAKDLPQDSHIVRLEPQDLSENKRKLEVWKKLVLLLGQGA